MIIERPTARIIVINHENRILLLKIEHANKKNRPCYWITPGGGIEAGETMQQAALRELQEETGITTAQLVEQPVWFGEVISHWDNKTWQLKQHFFIAYVSNIVEINTDGLGQVEKQLVCGYKWWSLDEMNQSTEYFIPNQLNALLRPIIIDKILPKQPMHIIID